MNAIEERLAKDRHKTMSSMIVTAWNNGAHNKSGAGYGIKLDANDRDRFFNRTWKTITLELEGSANPVDQSP